MVLSEVGCIDRLGKCNERGGSNFDNPINNIISYEKFLVFLEEGREIEFIYKDKEYFISHSTKEDCYERCK